MSEKKYSSLALENQLCFPLYACSKEIIRKYKPYLDKLDLTYTQYIAMMALWGHGDMSVKELGNKLMLDSGTLTPLLKKMEKKGYIARHRSKEDERNLIIRITEEGKKLRDDAIDVPVEMRKCVNLTQEEMSTLYKLLYKIISGLEDEA